MLGIPLLMALVTDQLPSW